MRKCRYESDFCASNNDNFEDRTFILDIRGLKIVANLRHSSHEHIRALAQIAETRRSLVHNRETVRVVHRQLHVLPMLQSIFLHFLSYFHTLFFVYQPV